MTEGEFLKRSGDLEGALTSGTLVEFCDRKIAESSNETETTLWSFLKVCLCSSNIKSLTLYFTA